MDVLWEAGEASVQEVLHALGRERSLAYTTVLTVLSRLHGKGLVMRRKEGRAHVYAAAAPREEISAPILDGVVRRLFGGSRSRAVAQLLDDGDEISDEELARLESMIRERRRERGQ